MKKIYFLAGAVAALVAVSCAKEKGADPTPVAPAIEEEDNTPVPVQFGSKLNNVETKAAVEVWNDANSPQSAALYIYGLEETKDQQGQTVYVKTAKPAVGNLDAVTEPFINNTLATPPTTTEVTDNQTPQAITVVNPRGGENEPYYYSPSNTTKYNFFGYYVDDAVLAENLVDGKPNPTLVEGTADNSVAGITLPVTINGTQDIMLAKTDKEEDLLNRQTEGFGAIASTDRLYSAYSARRGVKPNLNFEHQLSRFVFSIKKGGTVPDNDITLKSLKVETLRAATLHILGDAQEVANRKWDESTGAFTTEGAGSQNLYLVPTGDDAAFLDVTTVKGLEINDTPVTTDSPISADLGIHPTASYKTIGDIMVYPGQDVYNFTLDINQANITDAIPTQNLQIKMADVIKDNGDNANVQYAQPGKQYNVNLVVYGAEQVIITVTLTDWDVIGNIDIDPDEDDAIDTYTPRVTLTPAEITVGGEGSVASVTVLDKDGEAVEPASVTYASRNERVATVDGEGNITAVAAGTTKIVAYITLDGVEGTLVAAANLTVNPAPLPQLVINLTTATALNGTVGDADVAVEYTIVDDAETPNTVEDATVTIASDDEDVVTIVEGKIHFVAAGSANVTINATKEGYTAAEAKTIAVTVAAAPVVLPTPVITAEATIAISAEEIAAEGGATKTLFTSIAYGDENTAVDNDSISITVVDSEQAAVGSGFTLNAADKTLTVAQNTTAGTYTVTIHVAAKAETYNAAEDKAVTVTIAAE